MDLLTVLYLSLICLGLIAALRLRKLRQKLKSDEEKYRNLIEFIRSLVSIIAGGKDPEIIRTQYALRTKEYYGKFYEAVSGAILISDVLPRCRTETIEYFLHREESNSDSDLEDSLRDKLATLYIARLESEAVSLQACFSNLKKLQYLREDWYSDKQYDLAGKCEVAIILKAIELAEDPGTIYQLVPWLEEIEDDDPEMFETISRDMNTKMAELLSPSLA